MAETGVLASARTECPLSLGLTSSSLSGTGPMSKTVRPALHLTGRPPPRRRAGKVNWSGLLLRSPPMQCRKLRHHWDLDPPQVE